MPRPQRRGKNPRDSKENIVNIDIPSTVMHSILEKLDLTFERDIGMLNGKNTHSIPSRDTLVKVQEQLNILKDLFDSISKDDQEYIDKLRAIREERIKIEQQSRLEKEQMEQAKINSTVASPSSTAQNPEIVEEEQTAVLSNDGKSNLDNESSGKTIDDDGIVENMDNKATEDELTKKRPLENNEEKEEKEKEIQDKYSKEEEQKGEDDDEDKNEENPIELNGEKETTSNDNSNTNEGGSEEPVIKKQKTESVDIDQMENNPNVKNPKSEFVISQTLPQAARNLGLFSEEGLESTGENYLKKKYSVASYPTTDLKELLPGDLPDMDLSCAKPANQIQYSTFLSYVDNFYKDLTDDDIKFLKSKDILPANLEVDKSYDPEVTPFVIPKLGPLYTRTWFRTDANKNLGNTSPPHISDKSSVVAKKSASDIKDTSLESEDISCGPLLSRLMSAIFRDEGNDLARQITTDQANNTTSSTSIPDIKTENASDTTGNLGIESLEQTPTQSTMDTPMSDVEEITKFSIGGTTSTLKMDQGWKINSVNLDYPTLEERLKRELKYVGIYMNMPKDENNPNGSDPDWLTGREDDEISAELRELQSSLKQATANNQKRKETLIPLVDRQLAWLEYSSILDDLDKQVDQAYIKRIRVPKKRKKHHNSGSVNVGTASQIAQQKASNSSLKSLLDKRQRWITKIGPLFGPAELMKRIPKKSVFSNLEQEEEDDEADVFDQTHDGKDEGIET
ncbi:similar to Saccharomyces cerevisiae YDR176W NGG1 Transcriptional regulator involved in glucose repression of Gal4p-regulated genes [Maudiozyma barnettii]|uniref:Similar to Saccharomyces cerevisiae YDR176W NGG1 Transcriptional regulator involved in glucose repression of Gal4p-regulated genes n=1 Tax=Maudiozyma barnettii TaxID=61262 RepID=A0A8H2ZI93_9SACH|nr:histone acetyltransferase NGG1 [Kazachstania barnettii]CAB4255653.1 similar to Saccharomyces cerevisiae YDR176W NGG1 Transcriptional regulator involved in glucose repression of Gal4p-regulated genes [Kazachstania barnettii]CAD1784214.1 similar to Saccharomyces cerevisiae YDR176W NGG1 Transcriptional regulator involved in glucose repression of Gal4p-regulated genes [Kazachstania barnettii]